MSQSVYRILCFLIILLSIPTFALDPHKRITQYDIRVYKAKDGLPQNALKAVLQDSRGYLWIASQEGLVRFDGVRFVLFDKNKYPGLKENFILDIAEDWEGNLWLATAGGGISRFDGTTFTTFDTSHGLASNKVFRILIGKDRTIWLGTENGLTHIREGTFTNYTTANGLINNWIMALHEDRRGNLLISTIGPFPALNVLRNDTIVTFPMISRDEILSFYERPSGEVLAGSSMGKLYTFNDNKLAPFHTSQLPSDHRIWAIYGDQEGNLWFCTDGNGIVRYYDGRYESLVVENGLPGDNNFFYRVSEDREGSLWFVSDDGLFQLKHNKFIVFGRNEGFPSNFGHTVCEDISGNMWTGLRLKGLAKFSRYHTSTFGIEQGLISNDVLSISPARDGGLWIGTRFDLNYLKNGNIRHFSQSDIGSWYGFLALFENTLGELWIGSEDGFLTKYDGRQFLNYRLAGGETGDVITVIETTNREVWAGTRKKGLYRLIGRNIYRFTKKDGFTADGVNALYEDQEQTLWIATDGHGLYRYKDGKFFQFTSRSGLCFDLLFSILEDDQHCLWFSGNRGIFRVRKQQLNDFAEGKADTVTCQYFNYLDGMRETECNGRRQPSAWKSRDGRLWFTSIAGVVCVDPHNMPVNTLAPPVYIEEVITKEQRVIAPGSGVISLRAKERDLEFNYTALSFAVPERVQFKYWLEGYDPDTVYAGTRRTAFYTNLPKGNYTFHVIACNNDGVWNNEGASMRIRIPPFWWETGWAYWGYVIGGGLLLLWVIRIRTRKALAQAQLRLKAEHAAKLEELDRMKTRFFANISHEFRTPLTLILGPLEQFLAHKFSGDPAVQYRIMYRNARRLHELINQLLDLSKLEAGQMSLQTRPENIVSFLRTLVMSFTSLAERKRISLKFEAQEDEITVYLDRDKVEKIITNLLSNAFKFTPEEGKIKAAVAVGSSSHLSLSLPLPTAETEFAEITVSDTGPGIPPDRLEKIFDRFYQLDDSQTRKQEGSGIGLALVKELVELHKGNIRVSSEPGRGSCFVVRLPLGKGHLREDEIITDTGSQMPDTGYTQSDKRGAKNEERILRSDQPPVISDQGMPNFEDEQIDIAQSPNHQITISPNILIVEDNPDLRYYIRSYLNPTYRIMEAENGKEGFEKAIQTLPDMVISDVMMPEMDGFELCRKLKTDEKTSHIPVILLTALASPESKLEGLDTRADDYIIKPFNAEELLARTRNLIELRRQLRERYSREITLQPKDIAITRRDEEFLNKTISIIEEHLADKDFHVESLAEAIGWARETVYRKIKALTDLTVEKFIYDRRLRRAEQLLRESDYTVTEITYETGFSSPGHLARQFRERYGMSPKGYREQYANRMK